MPGHNHPAADGSDLVPAAPNPLHARGDTGWRVDLDDEVHRSHVDAELQTGSGHHRGQPAGLQIVLDERPLFPADAAVMGPGQRLIGVRARGVRLVQVGAQSFG